ncbi:MAG: hypothetical protein KGR69_14565 [Verrucomicrobia bacterium]|nr:hypothetical protein [Verrucomicrobiota bacterium]
MAAGNGFAVACALTLTHLVHPADQVLFTRSPNPLDSAVSRLSRACGYEPASHEETPGRPQPFRRETSW